MAERPTDTTSSRAEPSAPPMPGPHGAAAADRFTVLRLHARGGLGQVSLARDEKLKRLVALKEIRADRRGNTTLQQRFLAEAEITGQLEHPGIVPIYDLDQDADGQVRYAMRFVQGRTLADAIRAYHERPTPLAFRELVQRFLSVCQTIAYAHNQGVIHRDLKPANVVLGDYGETLVVDWGLAKRHRPGATTVATRSTMVADRDAPADQTTDFVASSTDEESLTQAGQVLGTPAYMAPEQASGDVEAVGPRADVYSLGALFYELLTGRPPFQGPTAAEVLAAVRQGRFTRPTSAATGVPPALEAVCLKAMARAIPARYAGAAELAQEVERWLADEPVTAYREPWFVRLGRWRRRHRTQVTAVGVLLLTALTVGGVAAVLTARERERSRGLAWVEGLREAVPSAVPLLLAGSAPNHPDVQTRLRAVWDEADLPAGQRRRIGLALLPADHPGVATRLLAMLLDTDEPQEFLILRDGLVAHLRESTAPLWDEARQQATPEPRCFRLLVALAAFDPASGHWTTVADRTATSLLAANSLHLGAWTAALAPVRGALIPPLCQVAKARPASEKGVTAATILTQYAADQPEVLTDLLLDATPAQYDRLWAQLPPSADTRAAMRRELDRVPPRSASDTSKDGLASRQANAAVSLLRLGQADLVWPLLRTGPEPRLRSYLIHRFAALQVDPAVLLLRLSQEPDPSARQALLLSLGEYPAARPSAAVREGMRGAALTAFRADADPGIHSAADWLLRLLGHARELAGAETPLVSSTPSANRRWYVNREGDTLAIMGPGTYPLSVPRRASVAASTETFRLERLPYALAVATRKVTLGQFRRFLIRYPDPEYPFIQPQPGDAQDPATQVTWLQAARYCRWLSEQEGIAEAEMCFPKVEEIREGMKLPTNYLRRTGYRLPLSTEWECACRAGTRTTRPYGSDDDLLREYGWHADSSGRQLRPVGLLKPNDLGLFDVLGNTFEWCSDLVYFSSGVEERVLRGSSRFLEASQALISPPGILANRPNYRGNECGMRVVRTLPPASAAP